MTGNSHLCFLRALSLIEIAGGNLSTGIEQLQK